MKVICVGVSKTGTKSITRALRHLGFKVYDWEEQTFDFLDHWVDVFQNGTKPNVKRVYQNADAAVDIPGAFFYEEILEAFPDCKVILSEREENAWVESLANQLLQVESFRNHVISMISPTAGKIYYVAHSYINALVGSVNSKSTYVFRKRYRIHNDRVKSTVPADKLLLYSVKQGWKPLCDFLSCDVPTVVFPYENIKGEIANMPLEITRAGRQVKWEIQRSVFLSFCALVMVVAIIVAIWKNY